MIFIRRVTVVRTPYIYDGNFYFEKTHILYILYKLLVQNP